MTRYSNPLPHNQAPNTQGRPAAPAQPGQAPQYEQPGWPRTAGRPPAPHYADPSGYPADPQAGNHQADPYAALRPDGYGYGQQQPAPAPDPYGLAGYTAPQPQPSYGTRAPAPSPAPAYGAQSDPYAAHAPSPYGTAPQTHAYGANGGGFGTPSAPAPQSAYGSGYGVAPNSNGHGSPSADQWGSPSLDTRDYGGHGYQNPAQGQWGTDHYGEPQLEPALGPAGGYQNGQHPQHGSFDQSYAEDDAHYEDEPRRGGWKKIVGLAACTVLLGGGLVVAYSSIMGPGDGKDAPLVKSASGPSKVKPSEPGGKQFAHADSKLMGRLSEGGTDSSTDPAGVRKVPVVTVGRDGSIQAPAAQPEEETRAVVAVPGLTVIDGLGGPPPMRATGDQHAAQSPPVKMVASADSSGPVVVAPPKNSSAAKPTETAAIDEQPAAKAEAPPKKEKVAAATPVAAPAATGPKPTGAGYVAVLASVPASGSSRIDALKQFADMQQKYTSILQNKTPDVQEANLGEKGTYHRLLVGPPGSRDSASSVCTQLKAQGYSGCWVTAY